MQQSKLTQFCDTLDKEEVYFFVANILSYCMITRRQLNKLFERDPRDEQLIKNINRCAYTRYSRNVYED